MSEPNHQHEGPSGPIEDPAVVDGLRARVMRPTTNRLCLLTAVWIVLTANHAFWTLLFETREPGYRGWLFAGSVFVALLGINLLLLRGLSPGRGLRWALSFLLVVAATTSWFTDSYGVAIDSSMLRNVVQTNLSEARDFLGWPLLWRLMWQAGLPIAILWWVRVQPVNGWQSARDYVLGVLAGFILALGAALPIYASYASFLRNQDVARYLIAPANVVIGSVTLVRKALHGHLPYVPVGTDAHRSPQRAARPPLPPLALRATARVQDFSLWGYQRNTNPRLKKQNVYFFSDAHSCGTSTAVSVPCMFSDLPRREFRLAEADRRDSVLDILQRAGVAVTWIDNQSGCKGVCTRIETLQAQQYHPESCSAGECLDDALLYALAKRLPDVTRDTVLVLHTMGSHGPAYYRRVPPGRELFRPTCPTRRIETCTDRQIINSYDNSIAYTDFVLAQLIDQLRAQQNRLDSALLYVSDHGESLGEEGLYLHGAPYLVAPEVQKRIPMLLWMSSGAPAWLHLDTRCLRGHLGDPVSHDNLSHTLLGIYDVQTNAYRSGLDVLRGCRHTT